MTTGRINQVERRKLFAYYYATRHHLVKFLAQKDHVNKTHSTICNLTGTNFHEHDSHLRAAIKSRPRRRLPTKQNANLTNSLVNNIFQTLWLHAWVLNSGRHCGFGLQSAQIYQKDAYSKTIYGTRIQLVCVESVYCTYVCEL